MGRRARQAGHLFLQSFDCIRVDHHGIGQCVLAECKNIRMRPRQCLDIERRLNKIVEDVDPDTLYYNGAERWIFDQLKIRFPEKEQMDLAGDAMREALSLRVAARGRAKYEQCA